MSSDAPLEEDHLVALRRDLATAGMTVGRISQVGGGRSAITAIADIESSEGPGRVAVRAELRGGGGLGIGSVNDMFVLHEQLQREGIRAPKPILVAEATSGSTYDILVTDFVSGDVPQPWRRAGREAVRTLREGGAFGRDFIENLARIHSVDVASLPRRIAHERAGAANSHPGRSRLRSRRWIESSGVFVHDPVLNYVDLWLEANQPSVTFRSGLVHGDYRMGNLVVRGNSVEAVLDWELAEAGEVLSDVAWLCGPQGRIDGYAAGLFSQDDLIREYEAATGKSVPFDLFSYLRVEGTLRTAAVWAQLSADEAKRGAYSLQRRCHDSVLRLIGQCAQSLGIPEFKAEMSGQEALLVRGLAASRGAVEADIRAEGGGSTLGPAARSAALLLERMTALTAGGPYRDYVELCERFIANAGVDVSGDNVPIPEKLTTVLRLLAAQEPTALSSSQVLELISRSAAPGIAFANQMVMSSHVSSQQPNDESGKA